MQQLKAARANKHAKHANYKNLDNYIWSDNNIDERSSDYFAVLLTAGKNINVWKPSGRTIYVEGSKRTQRRKKAELKKAAQNTRPITAYLPPALTSSNVASASTSTFGLSTELCVPTEVESIGSESMEVESIEVELVESMELELVKSMKTELVKLMETELVESLEAELVEPTADASAEIDEKTTMRLAIEELDGLLKKNDNQIDKDIRELNPVLLEYDDQDLTKLVKKSILPEKKKHCVITYNKTTLAANDDEKTGWGPKGEHKLHQKGQGRCIHISEFLCEPLGQVHLTEEQHAAYPEISKYYIMKLLEIGVNYEGYWNVQLLAKQLEQAIDILEIALPDTILVFGFDNSSSHGAFAEDALIVNRMNVGYGGKQPKICPGRFSDSMFQEIVFSLNHPDEKKGVNQKELRR
ncbi:1216_t:CDS:2 [Cetraspora pellucida]|uniref:1216_t:CDS:1 n=1 Tax=Cetraspora pellucida TaxID=1433469 RepID=A0A9N9CL86_9GLOM|nr:1216_t:CDS:2 [Cetraspora pellucida]